MCVRACMHSRDFFVMLDYFAFSSSSYESSGHSMAFQEVKERRELAFLICCVQCACLPFTLNKE